MGAWSHEPFGNDTACDWAYELKETTDLSLIEDAIETAAQSSGYLEAYEAEEAIAAIEVMAKLLGRGTQSDAYTEAVDQWILNTKEKPSDALIYKATSAINCILSENSELADLWEGKEEWINSTNHLKSILESALPSDYSAPNKQTDKIEIKSNKPEALNQAAEKHRFILVSLEPSINALGKEIKPARSSVVMQHQTVLNAIKGIEKDYEKILKSFYAAPPKAKGSIFAKLATIWGENITPVTKEELKDVEKTLGNNVTFPPSYRSAVLKVGIPTFSEEFSQRLQDVKSLNFIPPKDKGDPYVGTEEFLNIKRFLTPDEIIEKSQLIAEQTATPPTNVAIAIDGNGNLLCYKNCVKPAAQDPDHYGQPDLIYDPNNYAILKEEAIEGEFKEWIENYLLIKPLNISEESIQALKAPIENMQKTISALLDDDEYKENTRYHSAFGKLSNHISELSRLYTQEF
ncbi:MAG: DUF4259 domain-containing protein [Alphaproteobacteria bacterium]